MDIEGQERLKDAANLSADIDLDFDASYSRAREIDLTMVILKMCHPRIGMDWSEEFANRMAAEYRIFLAMKAAFPTEWLPPSQIMDEFWHNHILDTRAYQADCQNLAGRFIHHYPYFGMRDSDDYVALVQAFQAEAELYRKHVGREPPPDLWITQITVADVGRLVGAEFANPAAAAAAAAFAD